MKIVKSFILLAVAMFAAISAFGQGQTIYNSIPAPLPGNVVSLGYEATSTAEFGDRVQFGGTFRKVSRVTQTMSSWGCEAGSWYAGNCTTTSGASFSHPLTLRIYNVGPGNSVGSLITSVTKTFSIPYRPSADPINCTDGTWYNTADSSCYNGYAVNVTFELPGVSLPNQVIYSIAYNTTHYGDSPIGEGAACFSSSGGCGYDSLNVGLDGITSAGTNPDLDDAYIATTFAPYYCDGGTDGVGVFRRDDPVGPCNWTGYQPSVKFFAANPPVNANACKNGGWQTLTRLDGTTFRNQGDCVSYVNTGR